MVFPIDAMDDFVQSLKKPQTRLTPEQAQEASLYEVSSSSAKLAITETSVTSSRPTPATGSIYPWPGKYKIGYNWGIIAQAQENMVKRYVDGSGFIVPQVYTLSPIKNLVSPHKMPEIEYRMSPIYQEYRNVWIIENTLTANITGLKATNTGYREADELVLDNLFIDWSGVTTTKREIIRLYIGSTLAISVSVVLVGETKTLTTEIKNGTISLSREATGNTDNYLYSLGEIRLARNGLMKNLTNGISSTLTSATSDLTSPRGYTATSSTTYHPMSEVFWTSSTSVKLELRPISATVPLVLGGIRLAPVGSATGTQLRADRTRLR